ncbi:MAG: PilZ domain-containing protein [Planctomycetes bacterium]|nr:PilZ domain-containing protein [Planctomycetota bacterium]
MGDPAENRKFLRVTTEVEVDVTGAGGSASGTSSDLSLNGMLLKADAPFPEGSTCRATLFLDGRSGGARVVADGYVARTLPDGMAIEFTELLGLESWQHLRNLILYNAEDPVRAQAEFDSHLGLKPR